MIKSDYTLFYNKQISNSLSGFFITSGFLLSRKQKGYYRPGAGGRKKVIDVTLISTIVVPVKYYATVSSVRTFLILNK